MDNHPLVNPEQPIEILRTIHSFDPCMACGVHVLDATGADHRGEGPMSAGGSPAPQSRGSKGISLAHKVPPPAGDISGSTSGIGPSG